MKDWIKKIYYRLLHIVTGGKGIKVTINGAGMKMPTRYYRYYPADYEKENFLFFKEHAARGMTCIDVGAHFGVFAIYMHQQTGGTVYAFEPTVSTRNVLKEAIAVNRAADKVMVIPAAVDEKNGKMMFYAENEVGSVANTLVADTDNCTTVNGYEVDIVGLDSFVSSKNLRIDFLKIDAEGAELGVLKGASKILTEQRPFITLGLHPKTIRQRGDTLQDIWDLLQANRYDVSFNGQSIQQRDFCSRTDLFDVHLLPR